ncbi:hypothetical protein TrLO_g4765 [Triparma laevis f. longispina]|uniref:RING-type domain-containing protein n=1 Tax=Triparma laevis f. longispina TaxID=1714387 RepID=A0A9W7DVA6_9STRA|nr:hypothetical protein TrLO_g4765 [Triparma laevis f. longispina]
MPRHCSCPRQTLAIILGRRPRTPTNPPTNFTYFGRDTGLIRKNLRRVSSNTTIATAIQVLLLFLNLFSGWAFPIPLVVYEIIVFLLPIINCHAQSPPTSDKLFHLLGLLCLICGAWGFAGFFVLLTKDRTFFESTPLFLFARVRLDSDEDYTYESGAFWISIGVLAILNIITSTLYLIIGVTCFRLLHIYPYSGDSTDWDTRSVEDNTREIEMREDRERREAIEESEAIFAMEADLDFDPLEGECVICLEDFNASNPKQKTLCVCGVNKAKFHRSCINRWLRQKSTCPLCRGKMFYLNQIMEHQARSFSQHSRSSRSSSIRSRTNSVASSVTLTGSEAGDNSIHDDGVVDLEVGHPGTYLEEGEGDENQESRAVLAEEDEDSFVNSNTLPQSSPT